MCFLGGCDFSANKQALFVVCSRDACFVCVLLLLLLLPVAAVVSPPSGLSKVTGFHLGCLKAAGFNLGRLRATRFDLGCLSLNLCYDM